MKYNRNNKLRVFTAFSGYDSQCLALNRLKELYPEFDYTLVGWSEIEDAAIQAHNALFENAKSLNLNDITTIMLHFKRALHRLLKQQTAIHRQ